MSFGCRVTRAGSRTARAACGASSPTRAPPCEPAQWRMLADVRRFYADARSVLDGPELGDVTLGEWLDERRYGRPFRDHFIVPITSAVWSTPADRIDAFPVDYLLRFLDNHGLIGYRQRAALARRQAAARRLRRALVAAPPDGALRTGARRRRVARDPSASRSRHGGRSSSGSTPSSWPRTPTTHCACSSTPTPARHGAGRLRVLAPITWCSTPTSGSCRRTGRPGLLERQSRIAARPGDALTMTYHMNRLQSLPARPVLRLAQPGRRRPARVDHRARMFSHPMYTFRTLEAQAGSASLQGRPHLVRRRPPRLRVPRGWLSVRFEVAEMIRRPSRGARHEVAPARRHGPPPPLPAVHLWARARRLLLRPRPCRARRRRSTVLRLFGRNRAKSSRSATAITCRRRRRTFDADVRTHPAHPGRATRRAGA